MNKRVMIGILALAALAGASARADDKADAAKMVAEWAAIPDGTVAPAVADVLAFESQSIFAPTPQEVVYEMPGKNPGTGISVKDEAGQFDWTTRAKLTQIAPNLFKLEALPCLNGSAYACGPLNTLILDRTGLVIPYRKVLPSILAGDFLYLFWEKMSALAITAPQTYAGAAPDIPFSNYAFSVVAGSRLDSAENRTTYLCQLERQGGQANANCKNASIGFDPIGRIIKDSGNKSFSFTWNGQFNMYLPKYIDMDFSEGNGCYEELCNGHSHKVVDYRLPGGDWHSKAMSAALSPVDKQKATALFSAGFDSCKTGDFTGGIALLQRGLATDPANYQAHYTLADCARSAWLNKQDDYWLRSVAFYYYQRTDDLAPDSPEGVKAQGRIDGGLK